VTIQGQRQYLWRTVDQDGDVIDILVQPRRDQRAVDRFFRKLLKGQGREPRRLVTDKLRTYEAARRTLMPSVVHDTERYTNNRAEVSPEPIRQRERQMRGFKSGVKHNDSGRRTESIRIFSESDATCCVQLTTECCEPVPCLFGTR
jgi:putative transposase